MLRAQETVRFTDHPAEDRAPSWSPDGQKVLFESHRDGNSEIYVAEVDGSGLVRLTENKGVDQYPAWAPDGERVVFQSERDGRSCLWVMVIATREGACLLEDPSPELTPDWSPDGQWIAFTSKTSGNADLWAISAAGGQPVQLTHSPYRDVWPRWSPDGSALVFFSRRDTEGRRDELYILDWESRATRRLTVNPTAIVRHGESGALVRRAEAVGPGDPLRIQLGEGGLRARVEAVEEPSGD